MRPAAAALLLLVTSALAGGNDTPPPETIMLTGAVRNPGAVTQEELMKLPPVDVIVNQETDHGPVTGSFRGALLWTVIQQAQPIDGTEKNASLRHTFLVSGSDGYAAALSQGEIDPKLENKQVIVAYAENGAPFLGFRLIVPGDAQASRSVHDIAIIEVK